MELVNEWFPTGTFRKFDTPFRTDSTYEKELMDEILFTVDSLRKAEMEYHGNFWHTLVWIQHIDIMSRIDICYTSFRMVTQNVSPTLHGFQGLKLWVQYLDSHPHKPFFYPSNYYYGSNVIIFTWSGNQVEYYTTHNCLEWHQNADRDIILNRRRSVSGIIHNLLGVAVWCKVQIQPYVASDYTYG